jgi:hypothetical protein
MSNVYRLTSTSTREVHIDALQKKYGLRLIEAGELPKGEMLTVKSLDGTTYRFRREEDEGFMRFYNSGDYIGVDMIRKELRKYNKSGVMKNLGIVNEREGHEYSAGTIGDVQAKKDRKALFFEEPQSFAVIE